MHRIESGFFVLVLVLVLVLEKRKFVRRLFDMHSRTRTSTTTRTIRRKTTKAALAAPTCHGEVSTKADYLLFFYAMPYASCAMPCGIG